MKVVKDWQTAQLAINELFEFKHRFETQNFDLSGRRLTNAGGALDKNEFVVLHQLERSERELLARIEELNKRVSMVDGKLGAILQKIKELEGLVANLDFSVSMLNDRVNLIEDELGMSKKQ